MFVCLCHAISDKKIAQLVEQEGVYDLKGLRQLTPLGSQCGKCIRQAKVLIEHTVAAKYQKAS
ncbi:(2Fe-2S)-binding protein [Photobacterium japonica]|uniref:(2Fe-2S)-binding protein n=1 Tax=Photobacterium japonica TaxID=2910235 RepID=UPI003D0E1758